MGTIIAPLCLVGCIQCVKHDLKVKKKVGTNCTTNSLEFYLYQTTRRKYYIINVFFSVSFWVLALDHDLQIARETIGSVSVKDPAGTKVAVWDQVPLDEGKSLLLYYW